MGYYDCASLAGILFVRKSLTGGRAVNIHHSTPTYKLSMQSVLWTHENVHGQKWWTGCYPTYCGYCSVYRHSDPDRWEVSLIHSGQQYTMSGQGWKSDRQLARICNQLSDYARSQQIKAVLNEVVQP
jgi:hypothetical protein